MCVPTSLVHGPLTRSLTLIFSLVNATSLTNSPTVTPRLAMSPIIRTCRMRTPSGAGKPIAHAHLYMSTTPNVLPTTSEMRIRDVMAPIPST